MVATAELSSAALRSQCHFGEVFNMKSSIWIAPIAAVSVAALAVWAPDRLTSVIPQARAQVLQTGDAALLCPRGDATLHGAYMSRGGGTVIGVGPVAFIGTLYLDGKGGVTNPFTISFAGSISRVVAPGTYAVKSDCTGTMTLAGANNFDFRVSPDGSKLDYIQTDAGTVISGSAIRVPD
jgi:hypothetical protein